MNDHITRYDRMPIPPVESQTTWFDAGSVRIISARRATSNERRRYEEGEP